jgi:putative methionine-R-sulfoxide reductase with GAF domain
MGTTVERVRDATARAMRIEDVAWELADLIRHASGRRWVGIYRVTNALVVNLAWSGPGAPAHPTFPIGRGLTGAAIAGRATVCSNNVAADPRYLTNQATTGSELIVPVLLDDEVVGTLDVEEPEANAFGPEDETQFEEIAAVLSPLYVDRNVQARAPREAR